MKIAILSDIHGNLPALHAAMADLRRLSPDQVIVNGDIVGRGPQSVACMQTVAAQGWPCTMGNHERFWLDCTEGQLPDDWQNPWWLPMRASIAALPAAWVGWMGALPFQQVIDLPGAPPVLVVHGSPRRLNEGLYRRAPLETTLASLDNAPYDHVVGGHTHVPMDIRAGRYRVMNSGSVGAPFNGDPAAQYIVLTWQARAWQMDIRRVPYDREETYFAWRQTPYWAQGVAAHVFAYELETARFHFWTYVRFCEERGLDVSLPDSFAAYCQFAESGDFGGWQRKIFAH